jgi:acyl carrier protein
MAMVNLEEILAIVAKLDPPPEMKEFDPNRRFSDNGIDSLDMMSVFLTIEEKYGIKFSDAELEQSGTAVDLLSTLQAKLANG